MTSIEFATIREQFGISRAQLATLLGVAASTVGRWESGSLSIDRRTELALTTLRRNPMATNPHDPASEAIQTLAAMLDDAPSALRYAVVEAMNTRDAPTLWRIGHALYEQLFANSTFGTGPYLSHR